MATAFESMTELDQRVVSALRSFRRLKDRKGWSFRELPPVRQARAFIGSSIREFGSMMDPNTNVPAGSVVLYMHAGKPGTDQYMVTSYLVSPGDVELKSDDSLPDIYAKREAAHAELVRLIDEAELPAEVALG